MRTRSPRAEPNGHPGRTSATLPVAMTASSKAERRAARAVVAAYHEAELGKLIERLRAGIARYDAGVIDAFELDDLVHHYKRATQKLWSFCVGSGGQVGTARHPNVSFCGDLRISDGGTSRPQCADTWKHNGTTGA